MSKRPKTYDRPGYRSEEGYRRALDRAVDRETEHARVQHNLKENIFRELGRCIGSPVAPDLYAAFYRASASDVEQAIQSLITESRAVVRNGSLYRS